MRQSYVESNQIESSRVTDCMHASVQSLHLVSSLWISPVCDLLGAFIAPRVLCGSLQSFWMISVGSLSLPCVIMS